MPTIADLISAANRERLATQLAELAEEEATKPRPIPEAVFQPPPGPDDSDPETES